MTTLAAAINRVAPMAVEDLEDVETSASVQFYTDSEDYVGMAFLVTVKGRKPKNKILTPGVVDLMLVGELADLLISDIAEPGAGLRVRPSTGVMRLVAPPIPPQVGPAVLTLGSAALRVGYEAPTRSGPPPPAGAPVAVGGRR